MCEPTAIAAIGLSMVQTVSSFAGEMQSAKSQEAYYRQNAKAANDAAIREYADIQTLTAQEQVAADTEMAQSQREARLAASTTRVAAGEAGISGLSIDALLQDIKAKDAGYRDNVKQQSEWSMGQMQRDMQGVHAKAQDRINSVPRPTRPSFVNLGLSIGSTALSGYNAYKGPSSGSSQMTRTGYTSGVRGGYGRMVGGV